MSRVNGAKVAQEVPIEKYVTMRDVVISLGAKLNDVWIAANFGNVQAVKNPHGRGQVWHPRLLEVLGDPKLLAAAKSRAYQHKKAEKARLKSQGIAVLHRASSPPVNSHANGSSWLDAVKAALPPDYRLVADVRWVDGLQVVKSAQIEPRMEGDSA